MRIKRGLRVKKWLILATVAVTLILGGVIVLDQGLLTDALSLGGIRLKSAAQQAATQACREVLAQLPETEKLIDVERDANGRIVMLCANSSLINSISIKVIARAQELLSAESSEIRISLYDALGSTILSGKGPSFTIKNRVENASSGEFFGEFEGAGINQTRYRLYLQIHFEMRMTLAHRSQTINTTYPLLIGESVIIGEVPNMYWGTFSGSLTPKP